MANRLLRYSFEYLLQHAFALAAAGGRDYDLAARGEHARLRALLAERVAGFSEPQYRRALAALRLLRLLADRFYADPRVPSRAEALRRLKSRCPGFQEGQYETALSLAAGRLGRRAFPHFRR